MYNSSVTLVNNQLVCFQPVGILNLVDHNENSSAGLPVIVLPIIIKTIIIFLFVLFFAVVVVVVLVINKTY